MRFNFLMMVIIFIVPARMVKSAIGGLASDEYLRSVVRNGWGISVFAIDETKDIVAFGSSDGVMSVERLSDQTTLMRVGDERVPVLSIYYNDDAGVLGFGNAKGRVLLCRYVKLVRYP